jgi:hypothetical protein
MSISASSNATSELRTPRQSLGLDSPQDVEEEDDEEEEKEAPDDLPSMRIGSMPPKDIMSAATLRSSATLDVPIAQFARASFGCDSGDAERERARILSAIEDEGSYEGGDTERVRSIHSVYEHAHAHTQVAEKDAPTSSDGSECDSDLETSGDDQHAQDEEVATMQSRARADFFGAGSASARAARRSHASLNSLPANHELEHDLSHLRSSLLPTFRARVSLTSVDRANTDDSSTPTHSRPHSFSVSRQNSLSNLARRHEAALGRTSVLSHKSLSVRWSQDTTPLPILEEQKFHVSNPTSQRRMWEAATSFLFDEDGNAICFGDLLPKTVDDDIEEEEKDSDGALRAPSTSGPPPRAVVFFIRSFWCGLCQDYTLASIARLDPQVLKKHNVSVAVIGPGHWKILKPYRELFKCPFPFYTDPTRKLYRAMG